MHVCNCVSSAQLSKIPCGGIVAADAVAAPDAPSTLTTQANVQTRNHRRT
jgi:hypothetical protein